MPEQCANCQNVAPFGKLCAECEGIWLRERYAVVEAAEHMTERAIEFRAWCKENGHPDPYKD